MRAIPALSLGCVILLLAGCSSAPAPRYQLVMPARDPAWVARVARGPDAPAGLPRKVLVIAPARHTLTPRERGALERGLAARGVRVAFAPGETPPGWSEPTSQLAAQEGAEALLDLQEVGLGLAQHSRWFVLAPGTSTLREVDQAAWVAAPPGERHELSMGTLVLEARLMAAKDGALLASVSVELPEVNDPVSPYQAVLVRLGEQLFVDQSNYESAWDSRAMIDHLLEALAAALPAG